MYSLGSVWLMCLGLSFSAYGITLSGDVASYDAESNNVVGYTSDTWFTTTGAPTDWIYLRKQPIAAGSLTAIKMLGSNYIKYGFAPQTQPIITNAVANMILTAHEKDPNSAQQYRNYNRLKRIQITPSSYAQPGIGKISQIYITTDGNVQPNGWAQVDGNFITLANNEQAAIVTYAIGTDKAISYGTTCGWVLNIGSGQLEQICSMASWIQVD